jgi:deoxycytidine triphosphate deaminase
LVNCRYNLCAGKAFLPESGDELVITPNAAAGGRQPRNWSIKPSETLVIMTAESVNIPNNLYATYSQLNSLARNGILLMNVSIVEPGYQGRLSCFLVNFSKETVHLSPDDEVAKICFHELSQAPQTPVPLAITENDYQQGLVKSAQRYPVSFMNIGGVEERSAERATKAINKSIAWGGAIIAIFVLWTTLEPLTSKYIREKTGVMTNTQRVEIMKLQGELEKTKNELGKANDDLKAAQKSDELEKKLNAQAQQLEELKQAIKRR